MKVLYINYIDFNNLASGSSVRPAKIYKAMCELGYEVKMITGISTRKNIKERRLYLESQREDVDNNDYDYCYIEAKTTPIFWGNNGFEYDFIKNIKKKGIPIGLFYRDVYWKFPELFNIKGIKQFIIKQFQKMDLQFIKKYIDCVFLPSVKMNEFCEFKNYIALPSGCDEITLNLPNGLQNAIIYVGGLSYAYGSDILLEAFRRVNEKKSISLILVCREEEFEWLKQFTYDSDFRWLTVIHANSEQLSGYYQNADFAICSHRKNIYHDFCMPVKLFEYISFGKPIIATNCNEIMKTILTNGLGVCACDNAESLAQSILDCYSDSFNYSDAVKSVLDYRMKNLWIDRVKQISEALLCQH